MKKRIFAIVACGLFVLAIGASPRYLEELRIGGGFGDSADGGADLDKAGNISTDGVITCNGLTADEGQVAGESGVFSELAGRELLEAGQEDTTAGRLHVYGNNDTEAGAIYLHTPHAYDYTVDYWKLSSSLLGVLQLSGWGGTYEPGVILQFNAGTGSFSIAYDLAVWSGSIEAGRAGIEPAQGTLALYNYNSGSAPGYISFYSCNGTPSYLFAADDGTGLRICSSPPTSNTAGAWLTAAKFKAADSTTNAVDLATSEVAGLLPANKVGSGLTDAQISDAITVWSGSINNTPIGASAPSTARFSGLTVAGVMTDTTMTTWPADTPSPSVASGNVFKIPNTWTTGNNITGLSDGVAGQRILVIGGDCDCVIQDSGNFRLAGSWAGCSPDTLELFYDGTLWIEICRANN
ncbi:MAG: hypothetical protein NTZ09_20005 [Candidatus Hydrogenedentes bacterium]|nr:hypothetical protein [Candidatus Hydrogenedentota bacterium]